MRELRRAQGRCLIQRHHLRPRGAIALFLLRAPGCLVALFFNPRHSQSFETFVRCHLHAFAAMAGIARELVNLLNYFGMGTGRIGGWTVGVVG